MLNSAPSSASWSRLVRLEVGLPVTDVHEAQAVFDDAAVNSLEARSALNIAFEGLEVLSGESHQTLAGLKQDLQVSNPTL